MPKDQYILNHHQRSFLMQWKDINTEMQDWLTCRDKETTDCSALTVVSMSHPLSPSLRVHCRRVNKNIIRYRGSGCLLRNSICIRQGTITPLHRIIHSNCDWVDLCRIKLPEISAWMGDRFMKSHPSWGVGDSWWMLRVVQFVFFKNVTPERIPICQ